MATIIIPNSHKNLLFAATVSELTGAQFEEDGNELYIKDSPILNIPREAFDPCYKAMYGPNVQALEQMWQSLLRNKRGHLYEFSSRAIILGDYPKVWAISRHVLEFPSEAAKAKAEEQAKSEGYGCLADYIQAALEHFQCCRDEQPAE